MRLRIFLFVLFFSFLFVSTMQLAFGKVDDVSLKFDKKFITADIQSDAFRHLLAKDNASKRQDQIKKGVGTGKGKGMENRADDDKKNLMKKGPYSEELDEGLDADEQPKKHKKNKKQKKHKKQKKQKKQKMDKE